MATQTQCPNPQCRLVVRVPDDLGGRDVRCPRCSTRFSIAPSTGGSHPAPAAPPGVAVAAPPQVIGRYQVREKLGSGAFGTVYRAYDPQLDREVAVKVLRPEALASPQAVERFKREARAAAKMHHPHSALLPRAILFPQRPAPPGDGSTGGGRRRHPTGRGAPHTAQPGEPRRGPPSPHSPHPGDQLPGATSRGIY